MQGDICMYHFQISEWLNNIWTNAQLNWDKERSRRHKWKADKLLETFNGQISVKYDRDPDCNPETKQIRFPALMKFTFMLFL